LVPGVEPGVSGNEPPPGGLRPAGMTITYWLLLESGSGLPVVTVLVIVTSLPV